MGLRLKDMVELSMKFDGHEPGVDRNNNLGLEGDIDEGVRHV